MHQQAWHWPPKPEYSVSSIRRVMIKYKLRHYVTTADIWETILTKISDVSFHSYDSMYKFCSMLVLWWTIACCFLLKISPMQHLWIGPTWYWRQDFSHSEAWEKCPPLCRLHFQMHFLNSFTEYTLMQFLMKFVYKNSLDKIISIDLDHGLAPISPTQVSDSHLSPPGALQSRRASLQWT